MTGNGNSRAPYHAVRPRGAEQTPGQRFPANFKVIAFKLIAAVLPEGLEPSRLAALHFECSVSTNSTTGACASADTTSGRARIARITAGYCANAENISPYPPPNFKWGDAEAIGTAVGAHPDYSERAPTRLSTVQ